MVFLCKTFNQFILVFINSSFYIIRNTGIQYSVCFICQNIDIEHSYTPAYKSKLSFAKRFYRKLRFLQNDKYRAFACVLTENSASFYVRNLFVCSEKSAKQSRSSLNRPFLPSFRSTESLRHSVRKIDESYVYGETTLFRCHSGAKR